jgi:hypothetical protein
MEKKRRADRTGIRILLGPPEKEEKEEVEKPEVKETKGVDPLEKAVDMALRMPRVTTQPDNECFCKIHEGKRS